MRRKARRRERESRREALLAEDAVRRLRELDRPQRSLVALLAEARTPSPSRQRREDVERGLGGFGLLAAPFAAVRAVPAASDTWLLSVLPPRVRGGDAQRLAEALVAAFDARDLHRRRATRGLVARLRRW